MHREHLLQLLQDYAAQNPTEQAVVARIRAFVQAHADCFERSCPPGHITGSAWLVSADGRRVLLTHHRKLNRWLQPGGHADGDPRIEQVALREAEEESGLSGLYLPDLRIFDVDIHRIPARGAEPAHDHLDIRFVVRAGADERYQVSEESHDLAWVTVEALLAEDVEPSIRRMAEKWLQHASGAAAQGVQSPEQEMR